MIKVHGRNAFAAGFACLANIWSRLDEEGVPLLYLCIKLEAMMNQWRISTKRITGATRYLEPYEKTTGHWHDGTRGPDRDLRILDAKSLDIVRMLV